MSVTELEIKDRNSVFFKADNSRTVTFVGESGIEIKGLKTGENVEKIFSGLPSSGFQGQRTIIAQVLEDQSPVLLLWSENNEGLNGFAMPLTTENLLFQLGHSNEMINQIRKHFHDIKSPLNAIKGISYLLEEKSTDSEEDSQVTEYLKISVQNLIKYLNDFEAYLRPDLAQAVEKPQNEQEKPVSNPAVLKGYHVAIAEDDHSSRLIIEKILLHHGANVSAFENGKDLLQGMMGMPDLIILDYEMPEMNGKMTIIELQKKFAEQLCPVFALTGHYDHKFQTELYCLGFNKIFLKPVEGDIMVLEISKALENNTEVPLELILNNLDKFEVIDTSPLEVLEKYGEGIVEEAFDSFLNETRPEIDYLSTADALENIQETSRILHSLRTSSASLGLFKLSYFCAYLEVGCRKKRIKSDELSVINRYFMEILTDWQKNVQKLYGKGIKKNHAGR